MKLSVYLARRKEEELRVQQLRDSELRGLTFQTELLKTSLQQASDTYKDNVQASRQLDDKAQKIGAFAGVFVAAAFGYLKPTEMASLMNAAGQGSEIVLLLALTLFLACVASCLAVMWARRLPPPLAPLVIQSMVNDVKRIPPATITSESQQEYFQTQLTMWMPILGQQMAINRSKGRRLVLAQILLGMGMICVTALILRIVHPDFKLYIK
jgi:hypothetical protein